MMGLDWPSTKVRAEKTTPDGFSQCYQWGGLEGTLVVSESPEGLLKRRFLGPCSEWLTREVWGRAKMWISTKVPDMLLLLLVGDHRLRIILFFFATQHVGS